MTSQVLLFYTLIQMSPMTGEIIRYRQFQSMKLENFDIVIITCIGKDEIGKDVSRILSYVNMALMFQ